MVGSSDPRAQRIVHRNHMVRIGTMLNLVRIKCGSGWVTVTKEWYDTHPTGWTNVEFI